MAKKWSIQKKKSGNYLRLYQKWASRGKMNCTKNFKKIIVSKMVHEKVSMGLDWYIKWFASILIIDIRTQQFVGITGWLIVGIM